MDTMETQKKKPCCFFCQHYFDNHSGKEQRINGKLIKPCDSYCGYSGSGKKMKRIGKLEWSKEHHIPVWCPLYEEATTCLHCGNSVFHDQGGICKTCKRKG